MDPYNIVSKLVSHSTFKSANFRSGRGIYLMDYLTSAGFHERDLKSATVRDIDDLWDMYWQDEMKRVSKKIREKSAGF